jgi:hypothetical protein
VGVVSWPAEEDDCDVIGPGSGDMDVAISEGCELPVGKSKIGSSAAPAQVSVLGGDFQDCPSPSKGNMMGLADVPKSAASEGRLPGGVDRGGGDCAKSNEGQSEVPGRLGNGSSQGNWFEEGS